MPFELFGMTTFTESSTKFARINDDTNYTKIKIRSTLN